MRVKRVIFIRPAETNWNRLERWQGWVGAPINTHGRLQAEALANFVRHIGLSALYASDLRRAKDTAEVLAQRTALSVIYDSRLRERDMGRWQGLTLDEIKAWYPEAYNELRGDPQGFKIPGGESLEDVQARALAFFGDILLDAPGETIGVVTHTSVIGALFTQVIANYQPSEHKYGNTSVTTIKRDTDDSPWELVAFNDTSHLEGLTSRYAREFEVDEDV